MAQQVEEQRQLENSRNISRTLSAGNVCSEYSTYILICTTILIHLLITCCTYRAELMIALGISKGTNGLLSTPS